MAGLKEFVVVFTLCFIGSVAGSQCEVMRAPLNYAKWKGKLEMRQEPENEQGYYIDSLYVWATLPGEARLIDQRGRVLETISFRGERTELQKSFQSANFFYSIEFSLKGEARKAELWFETAGCEPGDLLKD